MIEFKQVSLEDKQIIESFIFAEDFMISDITFGNLFIWRFARQIRWAILYDCLIIETTYKGKPPFVFFPIGSGDKIKALKALQEHYLKQDLSLEFHSLELKNLEIIKDTFEDVKFFLNRDRSDYVYLTQNLINLQGRKYHKKKNHLNRFFEEHQGFIYHTINEENAKLLKQTYSIWYKNMPYDEGLEHEFMGISDTFDNYKNLSFKGGYITCQGQLMGFSFGEVVNASLCIIHIEKADIKYRGAYQAINQQLLLHEFSDIKYANREEDLGIEGLRKAKLSYYPEVIVDKYEATICK